MPLTVASTSPSIPVNQLHPPAQQALFTAWRPASNPRRHPRLCNFLTVLGAGSGISSLPRPPRTLSPLSPAPLSSPCAQQLYRFVSFGRIVTFLAHEVWLHQNQILTMRGKRRTNVTCNQKKRSEATETSIAMLLLWLYVVAVAVPRAADCAFMDGASSGAGKTKRPLRSKNPPKNRLPLTLPLLSNNTVNTGNSLN